MSAPSTGISPDLSASSLQELIREVHDLRQRVLNLEQRLSQSVPEPAAVPLAVHGEMHVPSNAVPVIGRALLALAGAYVLRALTDLGVLSHTIGVTAGLVYGLVWLFVAARLPAAAKFAMAMSALTSVAIIAPLLWEASIQWNAIPSRVAAAVLAGYALAGLGLAWAKRLTMIAGVASAGAALIAAALLLGTHDLLPFTVTLLAIASALEFEACGGRQNPARWITAVAADAAVLLLAWIVSLPAGLPEGYAAVPAWGAVAAPLLLIAVYGTSAITQTLVLRRRFSLLEVLQTAAAAVIGITATAWIAGRNPAGMLVIGVCALIAGAGCYIVSFVLVPAGNNWNFRAWATFGLLLVVCGSYLPLSGSMAWAVWCLCAVACCWIAVVARKPTLGLHGAVYLLLGAIASGAAANAVAQLFGGNGRSPGIFFSAVMLSAVLCWIAIDRSTPGESALWRRQVALFLIGFSTVSILAGGAVQAIVRLWPASRHAPADTLATVMLTASSVALAWISRRYARRDLVGIVYTLMVVALLKLAARDFPQEHHLALVISLLCYGGALMILPWIVQKKASAAA